MNVTNQKPQVLSPIYISSITGDFAPDDDVMNSITLPLFTPIASGQVSINDGTNDLSEAEVNNLILDCMGDAINPLTEPVVKDLFSKTLVYFDKTFNASTQEIFLTQAAVKEKMPEATPTTIYTPLTDVIPSAKEVLAGLANHDKFFVSLGYFARPRTLGFSCTNATEFAKFLTWLQNNTAPLLPSLPSDTTSLLSDFQNLTLQGLTESIVIRNDDDDNTNEYSFARLIVNMAMQYAQANPNSFNVLPFHVGELFCPKTLVFVNIEAHAHSSAKKITDEWTIINKSIKGKPRVVNPKTLNQLTATTRALQKIQSAAAAATNRKPNGVARGSRVKFRAKQPSTLDLGKLIKRVLAKMTNVNRSENSYKNIKMSFARPNRRDPDDFNKQGKVVSTKYKPDIHLYIDTSGSISEDNYQDTVLMLIKMAKKLNVNFYFNSFSHCLSASTHLTVKDRSVNAIYKSFEKVPKVTGGTDYRQIWEYIEASPKRKKELSIIITDFEYSAPSDYVKHPRNLYYVPISNTDWNYILSDAKNFCATMTHIEPNIRLRLLF